MKTLLLTISLLSCLNFVSAQNINDHKVNFNYIQLPYFKIDPKFDKYEIRIEHEYLKANQDSTAIHQMRQDAAMASFMTLAQLYSAKRDSLDKMYLRSLSTWEKAVNVGTTNADGTPLTKPNPPVYPEPPMYPKLLAPILHTPLNAAEVNQGTKIQGFTEGLGGFIVTITYHPIQHLPIKQTVSGTGASLKYEYNAPYILPIGIKVETPTQGTIFNETVFQGVNNFNLPTQKSQYDHHIYMMENRAKVYADIEAFARRSAINNTNDYINNQIGYVVRQRVAELYSVKNHKNYEYSDVTDAFTKATIALQLVSNDRDRSGAIAKIDVALQAHQSVLEESNLYDNKARINDKITAMLQCNMAELLVWKAEFDKADGLVNIAMNSGEGKAKRHMQDEQGFYSDQRKRWDVHY